MGRYLVLSNLTEVGRKAIRKNPKRIIDVNKELEKMGVKVIEQFALLGPYDFASIIECLDNETVMRMAMELGARGTLKLMSLPAVHIEDLIKTL